MYSEIEQRGVCGQDSSGKNVYVKNNHSRRSLIVTYKQIDLDLQKHVLKEFILKVQVGPRGKDLLGCTKIYSKADLITGEQSVLGYRRWELISEIFI